MGALVTVMVSPQLKDGCDVTRDAAAALIAGGWTPPVDRRDRLGVRARPFTTWSAAATPGRTSRPDLRGPTKALPQTAGKCDHGKTATILLVFPKIGP